MVTGAGGFIGSEVVRYLVAARHDVIGLDREAPLNRIGHLKDQIAMVAMDLGDVDGLRACLKVHRPDAIIHLAWYANPQDYLVSHSNLSSLSMTNLLVETALTEGCRKLVMAGTCVEYAPRDRPLLEHDTVAPRTLYGACKHAAWLVSESLANAAAAEISWARIFHMHGPREHENRLIPWVVRELRAGRSVELTDGNQIRDHLHISDVASGLVTLLSPGASGIYNLCSGEPVTLKEVLETVADILGRPDLLRFGARPHRSGEIMFLAGDSSRLRSLGWRPRFHLRDGLADSLSTS
jgi:UDP-glucuronate decarboxylase